MHKGDNRSNIFFNSNSGETHQKYQWSDDYLPTSSQNEITKVFELDHTASDSSDDKNQQFFPAIENCLPPKACSSHQDLTNPKEGQSSLKRSGRVELPAKRKSTNRLDSPVHKQVSFSQIVEHSDSGCSMLEQAITATENTSPSPEAELCMEQSSAEKEVGPLDILHELEMGEELKVGVGESQQDDLGDDSISYKTAVSQLGEEGTGSSVPKDDGKEPLSRSYCYEDSLRNNEIQEVGVETSVMSSDQDSEERNPDEAPACLPAQPPSAFQLFVVDFKAKYKHRFTHLTVEEIIDLCVEIWKEMGGDRKAEFQHVASRMHDEYTEQVKLYHARRGRPSTAYQIFMSDFLARVNAKRKNMRSASKLTKLDLYQRAIRKWKRLTKTERAIYQEQSRLSQAYAGRAKTVATVSEPIFSKQKM